MQVARTDSFINLREVSKRFHLPPGRYCIIPSTFDRDEEGHFMLRVYVEKYWGSADKAIKEGRDTMRRVGDNFAVPGRQMSNPGWAAGGMDATE